MLEGLEYAPAPDYWRATAKITLATVVLGIVLVVWLLRLSDWRTAYLAWTGLLWSGCLIAAGVVHLLRTWANRGAA